MPEAGAILRQIGHFRIEKKLARGGFGDVYRALNTRENRTVALKLLEHDLTDPVVMEAEKFGTALQTHLCRIEPRVVTVHDSGDLDGYFFVEMAYVNGKDLSKLLSRERRFDPQRAAAVIAELCVALASAHSFPLEVDGRQLRAICHGDIKPNNILLEENDQLRVVDFGTAKGLTLTRRQTSNSIGSVEYFSPERLRTGQVDEMSDLWAAAVVLFELFEGRRPFEAATPERLEQRIQSGVDPQGFSTSGAPALSDVLHKALHRDPSRRYQSAKEFEADLRRFLAAEQTEASKLSADEHLEGAVSRSAAWGAETRRTEAPSATVRTEPSPSTVRTTQPPVSACENVGPQMGSGHVSHRPSAKLGPHSFRGLRSTPDVGSVELSRGNGFEKKGRSQGDIRQKRVDRISTREEQEHLGRDPLACRLFSPVRGAGRLHGHD